MSTVQNCERNVSWGVYFRNLLFQIIIESHEWESSLNSLCKNRENVFWIFTIQLAYSLTIYCIAAAALLHSYFDSLIWKSQSYNVRYGSCTNFYSYSQFSTKVMLWKMFWKCQLMLFEALNSFCTIFNVKWEKRILQWICRKKKLSVE